jgi:hypothetical protein
MDEVENRAKTLVTLHRRQVAQSLRELVDSMDKENRGCVKERVGYGRPSTRDVVQSCQRALLARPFLPDTPIIPNQLQTAALSLRGAGWCGFGTAGESSSTVRCRRMPLAIFHTRRIFRYGQ